MSRPSTDTAIEPALAARERKEQLPLDSKVKDPHTPGKRDRLAGAPAKRFAPDIAGELVHTSGQRPRPASGLDPPAGGKPWSVTQWCEYVGVSRTSYYQLKKEGKTPDELHVGGRRLITWEAHLRWCRKNTVRARPQLEQQQS
jgi:hypothetical protein